MNKLTKVLLMKMAALVQSEVGVSMNDIGSDTAIETSDIVLMFDDINQLEWRIFKMFAILLLKSPFV
ncbi:hypothetical protein [Staphylococcus gallinarum]|uniref:hypothetical protein n=1 Tax=Staphylococcus gallinarum TaxID=1293 RepID=UPI002DC00670|nr:hypothetical protein [Staphylococcus gallinarum]MEB7040073.1 hypothetical protein [Staphylococcus gallinarum]